MELQCFRYICRMPLHISLWRYSRTGLVEDPGADPEHMGGIIFHLAWEHISVLVGIQRAWGEGHVV